METVNETKAYTVYKHVHYRKAWEDKTIQPTSSKAAPDEDKGMAEYQQQRVKGNENERGRQREIKNGRRPGGYCSE